MQDTLAERTATMEALVRELVEEGVIPAKAIDRIVARVPFEIIVRRAAHRTVVSCQAK